MHHFTVQCNTVKHSVMKCSAVQCSAVQYRISAVQCSAVQCSTGSVQWSAVILHCQLGLKDHCLCCSGRKDCHISASTFHTEQCTANSTLHSKFYTCLHFIFHTSFCTSLHVTALHYWSLVMFCWSPASAAGKYSQMKPIGGF